MIQKNKTSKFFKVLTIYLMVKKSQKRSTTSSYGTNSKEIIQYFAAWKKIWLSGKLIN